MKKFITHRYKNSSRLSPTAVNPYALQMLIFKRFGVQIRNDKELTAQKRTMDETEYLMSSPAMTEIIRQGQEDIKNGRGKVVNIEELWK